MREPRSYRSLVHLYSRPFWLYLANIIFSPYVLSVSRSLVVIFSLSLLCMSNLYFVYLSFSSLTFLRFLERSFAGSPGRSSCHSIASASLFSALSPQLHLHSLDAASLHPFSWCVAASLPLPHPSAPTPLSRPLSNARTREKEWREMTVARDGKSRYPSTANPSFLSEVIGCAAQWISLGARYSGANAAGLSSTFQRMIGQSLTRLRLFFHGFLVVAHARKSTHSGRRFDKYHRTTAHF